LLSTFFSWVVVSFSENDGDITVTVPTPNIYYEIALVVITLLIITIAIGQLSKKMYLSKIQLVFGLCTGLLTFIMIQEINSPYFYLSGRFPLVYALRSGGLLVFLVSLIQFLNARQKERALEQESGKRLSP